MKQGILEVSRTPIYPIGKRLPLDERVFHYCKSGLTYVGGFRGWGNDNHVAVDEVVLPAEVPAGSITLLVTDATGALAHDYKDGWLLCHRPAGYNNQMYRIKDNDATVAGVTRIYLYQPTAYIMPATFTVYIHKNIYSKVMRIGINEAGVAIPDWRTVVCVPWIDLVLGDYFWGQTWGPCWGFYSVAEPGIAQYRRDLYFSSDGCLVTADELVGAGYGNYGARHAGVILPRTALADGSCFYMLELAP